MKYLYSIKIGLVAVIALLLTSCEKNPEGIIVEYAITPMNNNFISITYTGSTGESVSITDYTQFQDGIKKITVTEKPFLARITTVVDNQTYQTFNYTLTITVDGELKEWESCDAPPMAVSTGETEYTIQKMPG